MHFSSFAYFNSGLDCREMSDFDELGALIKGYVARRKKEKVILGLWLFGAHRSREKLPDRHDLDRITDHPLMIVKYDGHAAVGNSALISKMPAAILADPGFDQNTAGFT